MAHACKWYVCWVGLHALYMSLSLQLRSVHGEYACSTALYVSMVIYVGLLAKSLKGRPELERDMSLNYVHAHTHCCM